MCAACVIPRVGQPRNIFACHQVAVALQRALELQHGDIVKMLIGLPGVDLAKVSMGRLFATPDDGFLRHNRGLQSRLSRHVSQDRHLQEVQDPVCRPPYPLMK